MDIHDTRQMLRYKSLYDIPLRVTYYARVSSDTDEQLNSLDNQISYYEDFIRKNQAWTFVPGYVDEGLSGISTKKRENFNRMVDDARGKMFDLIITKEISRFARNTLDSIQFTRQLLSYGVGVFFQNDNINTIDEDSELRLAIMSSIAQEELRKLSSRVKFGHQQAIKKSVVLGNSRVFGYRKANGKLVIDEEEAEMVEELFTLYSTDQYSLKQIEDIFWGKGYRNLNGNRISHSTLSKMIANPKYKGYYVGNKVRVVDMFTKKQKYLPKEEWVMFKDETGEIVPAIVPEAVWNKANTILQRRSDDVKTRKGISNHANLYTGKIFCTHCNTPYYMKESKDRHGNVNSRWMCSGRLSNGKDSCGSFAIYEHELNKVLFEVFKDTKDISAKMLVAYENMYRRVINDNSAIKKANSFEAKLKLAIKKKNKLLELVAADAITVAEYKTMSDQCAEEILSLEKKIEELRKSERSAEEFREHMEHVHSVLLAAEADVSNGVITPAFVNTFVNKIYATPMDDGSMRLDIQIFTGQTTQKYIDKLKSRMVHITSPETGITENAEPAAESDDAVPMVSMMNIMDTIRTITCYRIDRRTVQHRVEIRYAASLSI